MKYRGSLSLPVSASGVLAEHLALLHMRAVTRSLTPFSWRPVPSFDFFPSLDMIIWAGARRRGPFLHGLVLLARLANLLNHSGNSIVVHASHLPVDRLAHKSVTTDNVLHPVRRGGEVLELRSFSVWLGLSRELRAHFDRKDVNCSSVDGQFQSTCLGNQLQDASLNLFERQVCSR